MLDSNTQPLTEDELTRIDFFIEQSRDIIGTTQVAPLRFSHSVGDLTMHLYIEKVEHKNKS